MAQSLSLTSFVMEHRLPWAEGSSAAPPGAGRFDGAFIIDAGQRRACTVRSVSPLGATLTGEIAAREGAELAIELVSGQRPAATVEWVGEGEAGVRFKQPIDVLALINRTLVNQPAERRSMPRRAALQSVREMGRETVRRSPAQYLRARNAGGRR